MISFHSSFLLTSDFSAKNLCQCRDYMSRWENVMLLLSLGVEKFCPWIFVLIKNLEWQISTHVTTTKFETGCAWRHTMHIMYMHVHVHVWHAVVIDSTLLCTCTCVGKSSSKLSVLARRWQVCAQGLPCWKVLRSKLLEFLVGKAHNLTTFLTMLSRRRSHLSWRVLHLR